MLGVAVLSSLLPRSVVVVESVGVGVSSAPLLPEEADALGAHAVEKRRREFAAGRDCARRALTQLGYVNVPVPRGEDGQPRWPADVVGSITHCAGYCAAAVARSAALASIGIDAEVHAALSSNVEEFVCSDAERSWIRSVREPGAIHWGTVMFSAKESVYKAWFQLTRGALTFEQVELQIDAAARQFVARITPAHRESASLVGRFDVERSLVLTAVAIPHAG